VVSTTLPLQYGQVTRARETFGSTRSERPHLLHGIVTGEVGLACDLASPARAACETESP